MKKGKRRNKRKKTRSRLLWIAIAVIGIAAVISAVCVAGMLATKENAYGFYSALYNKKNL